MPLDLKPELSLNVANLGYFAILMNLPPLNYHHLRLFWEVARAGSLRTASERLRLSQPTVSAQIKALENSLDEQLFDRTGRGLKITAKGRVVMECATEIFSLGAEMLRGLQGQGAARSLRLNVGITNSLPKLIAWRLIRPAVEAFPNLQLSCSEGHAQELLGSLASGRLDVVLSDDAAPASLPVKAFNQLVGKSPVVFCAASALAKKTTKSFPASLEDSPLLLPASGTAWRQEIDRWLELHRICPRVVAEFDDAALMKTAAADGMGIAPIAAAVLAEAVDRYRLLPVGRAARCSFACYLITLQHAMRHPAVAVIAVAGRDLFSKKKQLST